MAQFTKKAIMESFTELLNEKPLDKITIKDITDKCEINRNTFYYYFQDVYDLLEEVFNIETERVLNETDESAPWQERFVISTKFALNNKKAIFHIYNSISREQLEKYLYRVTDELMSKFVKSQTDVSESNEKDVQLVVMLYKYALVGLTLDWVSKGMVDEPTSMINRVAKIMEGTTKEILKKNKK